MNAFDKLRTLRDRNDAVKIQMDAMRPRFESLRDRHLNGTAPRAVSAFNLFQTPKELALMVASALDLRPGMRFLEPSAGLGRLLDAVLASGPSETVAVEMAADCARELYQQDRPGVTIKQRDFLTLTPSDIGRFDRIAMNPPFHMRADIRHILHAVQFLKPGGKLVAICMAGPMRRKAFDGFTWQDLPGKSFSKEGASVDTAMVSISKE